VEIAVEFIGPIQEALYFLEDPKDLFTKLLPFSNSVVAEYPEELAFMPVCGATIQV
jgi:hypothetical protein